MRTLFLTIALTLALAAPAAAQDATQDGYTGAGPQVIERTGGNGGSGGSAGAGSLPFTGLDILLVAGLGAGLLGIGAGMRRLTQPDAAPQTPSH